MMSKPKRRTESTTPNPQLADRTVGKFHFSFLNDHQREAWDAIEANEITFLLGPAGCGKTQIATAYAAKAFLQKRARKILLTRPMVCTEQMGYLPGSSDEKIHPFLIPILDSLDMCCGAGGQDRKRIDEALEFAPLAFMRGRTFNHSVALLDEAQNATAAQLKLFLTRVGRRSKLIVTGDPFQSDLREGCMDVVSRLENIPGVAIIRLPEEAQVRNPLITRILEKM